MLSDDVRRRTYDQYGRDGLRSRPGHDFRSMNPDDIFSMFDDIFGGSFGGRRAGRARTRGFDLETEVELELEEVLTGATREVAFTRLDVCTTCSGSGAKPGTQPATCSRCGGSGQVTQGRSWWHVQNGHGLSRLPGGVERSSPNAASIAAAWAVFRSIVDSRVRFPPGSMMVRPFGSPAKAKSHHLRNPTPRVRAREVICTWLPACIPTSSSSVMAITCSSCCRLHSPSWLWGRRSKCPGWGRGKYTNCIFQPAQHGALFRIEGLECLIFEYARRHRRGRPSDGSEEAG